MRAQHPIKKSQTQIQPARNFGLTRNISTPSPKHILKRQKSDFTLAFMDSSEQVKKLSQKAQKSEMIQKIDKMRIAANSDRRQSSMAPESRVQGETLER